MKTPIVFGLFLATSVLASVVFIADPTTRRVTQIITSAHTPDYENNTNAFVNPVIDANVVLTSPLKVLPNGHVTNITAAEISSDATAAWLGFSNGVFQARLDNQLGAALAMYGTNAGERILRAFALLTLDQINVLRKTNSMSVISTNTFLNAMSNAVYLDTK